jgi:SAM-dependent methyltransferase
MQTRELYEKYPHDNEYIRSYIAYQERYAKDARDSDKKLIELIGRLLAEHAPADRRPRLLDIGCSTGNLLIHIHRAFPGLELTGGDLSELSIAGCKSNPALAGVSLQVMDILRLGERPDHYDIVTTNAILYGFTDELFEASLKSINEALVPGGWLVAFDFFHPWEQDVALIEKSALFPEGHPLHFRSYSSARKALSAAGFEEPRFVPFEIGIDLPDNGPASISTRTVAAKDGRRLQFRGCLTQPWCHMAVRKPA